MRCSLCLTGLLPALLLAACGGSGEVTTPPPPPPPPPATTGSLAVSVSGLPPSTSAAVTVNGPSGYTSNVTAGTTLTSLTPGSYSVATAPVTQSGFAYEAGTVTAVTVTAGATAHASVLYDIAVLPRATADRADEGSGSRFKVLYVLPSDGTDHNYDASRLIHRSLSTAMRWFASQTGGKVLRLDLSAGKPDITFVRLARNEATLAGFGAQIRDQIENDLTTAGFTGSDTKLLLVFYDGNNTAVCGNSPLRPITGGYATVVYLKGALPGGAPACETNAFAATPFSEPGYREFVTLHEMIHDMGGVTATAPDYVALGHVNNDPTDLMYAGSQPWAPARLDYLHRNYYSTTGLGGGLWNLATSPFLVTP